MKDALGHGSNSREGYWGEPGKASLSTKPPHNYGRTSGSGPFVRPEFPHPDSPAGQALTAKGQGHQGTLDFGEVDNMHSPSNVLGTADTTYHNIPGGGYYSRVSAKNGRKIGETGPHGSHEEAAAAAFAKYPRAKGVSTQRGQYGMDIRYHNRPY